MNCISKNIDDMDVLIDAEDEHFLIGKNWRVMQSRTMKYLRFESKVNCVKITHYFHRLIMNAKK